MLGLADAILGPPLSLFRQLELIPSAVPTTCPGPHDPCPGETQECYSEVPQLADSVPGERQCSVSGRHILWPIN